MSNQLKDLLAAWHPRRDEDWVLGTVYKAEWSAYRKAGAFMPIDDLGQQHGMLSGGCLMQMTYLHVDADVGKGYSGCQRFSVTDWWNFSFSSKPEANGDSSGRGPKQCFADDQDPQAVQPSLSLVTCSPSVKDTYDLNRGQ